MVKRGALHLFGHESKRIGALEAADGINCSRKSQGGYRTKSDAGELHNISVKSDAC